MLLGALFVIGVIGSGLAYLGARQISMSNRGVAKLGIYFSNS